MPRVWGLISNEGLPLVHTFLEMTRRFARDERATATVEFVIALPLLLAMMVFAVQYGNAIRVKNSLDSATRDAARFLARTPISSDGSMDVYFQNRALSLVTNQINQKANNIQLTSVVDNQSAQVTISADVPFPLLRLTGFYDQGSAFITMNTSQLWRRTGTAVETSAN